MSSFSIARRFAFPVALTLTALWGAAEVLRPMPARASSGCTNTECQGTIFCRFVRRYDCTFDQWGSTCTNTVCATSPT